MESTTLFVAFALCAISIQAQFSGDRCMHQASTKQGICKNLIECPAAIADLQKQKLPQTCSFQGTTPIVCCPQDEVQVQVLSNVPAPGTKSKQQCKEYAKTVFSTFIAPTLALGNAENQTRNNCGFKVVKLVVGGTPAGGKEFPHMAAIGYDAADGSGRLYHCGGSLISEKYVLTAAHCASSRENGLAKYVRLGDLNLKTTDDIADPQEYDIEEFVRHPEYRPPARYNDIALIRMSASARFTQFVRPTCLTAMFQPPTSSAIATGWGRTGGSEGTSDQLLKVTLDFFTQQECSNSFQPNSRNLRDGINEQQHLCAGSKTEFKDTCPGDSGGPLQVYNLDGEYCMYTLVGVTSFGKICGASHSPAVYTRVAHYLQWIENIVWP